MLAYLSPSFSLFDSMLSVFGVGAQKRASADTPPVTLEPPPPPKRARLVEPLQHLPENVASIVDAFAPKCSQKPHFHAFQAIYGNRIPAAYHDEIHHPGSYPRLFHSNLRRFVWLIDIARYGRYLKEGTPILVDFKEQKHWEVYKYCLSKRVCVPPRFV